MSQDNTSIQQSALTSPLDQLSLPTVNIIGQVGVSTNNTVPATYKTDTDPSSGPFFANTANNIQLFTDIYNSNVNVENVIDGVPHSGSLDKFLHSVLGISYSESTTAVCVKYIKSPCRFGNDENGVPYTTAWTRNFGDMIIPVGAQLEAINKNINGGFVSMRGAARVFGSNHENLYKDKWFLLQDILDAVSSYMLDRSLAPIALVENTTCKDNAGADDFYTYATSRDFYKLALKLENKLQGITGVTSTSPPENLSIPFPVSDPTIRAIFVNPADAATFSSRVLDVKINPDSIQTGPSDPTKVMKIFNTKKFNFSDDIVPLDTKSPTVLQSLNLVDRKADKNFDLANAVESNVWATGVGDWRNSQVDDPNITAQLSAAGYTESGSQALRRLNLIPVTSGDKIQVLSADSAGDPILVVDESAQVNLLEATWTAWQNITKLNTNMYGISATNMPDLSATALISELSGNSVIENLNLLYNMYLTGGDGTSESGTDFTPIIDTLSSQQDALDDEIVTLREALTGLTQVTELSSMINTLSSVDHVTIINQLSGLTQDLSGIDALSGDMDRFEELVDNIVNVEIPSLSSCCETNSTTITELADKINNLSVTELSGIVDALSAIDITTYITQLSSIEQQITNLTDIENYIDLINNNTTYSDTLSTELSALSANIYDAVDTIQQQVLNTTVEEISAITQIINNIQNVDELLQALSGDTRFNELSTCCESNLVNITQLTEQLGDYTVVVNKHTADIDTLSGAISEPAGVVLTTKNQTITGEKTFKSTMTVAASSYFEECMTVGDTEQPVVFNVYSVDGQTRVNIKNLPTIAQINDLNPGDLYIRTVDGHDLLAVKQDPGA